MRLAVAGGGTGGHIYPAVSAIEALAEKAPELQVLWLGLPGKPEEGVAAAQGWSFAPVSSAQVHGTGWRTPFNVLRAFAGAIGAARALKRFEATVLFCTGGYVSVPGALGARLAGVPVVLFLPDASPGWAVRFLRHFVQVRAASNDVAAASLGPGTAVTGYPVRASFFGADREAARHKFGLDTRPAVLVLGGSSGARRLNQAVLRWGAEILAVADVIHVTGRGEHEAVQEAALAAGFGPSYQAHAFLEDLPEAMVAADLVVGRAGAAAIGELAAAGKPAVLVPGTFGGGHQRHNAEYMLQQGSATVLTDDTVLEELGPHVVALLQDSERLQTMAAAARALACPEASANLAEVIATAARGYCAR